VDQLRAFEGLVRCGHCQNVFDGYVNLDASLPTLTEKVLLNLASTAPPQVIRSRQSEVQIQSVDRHAYDSDDKMNKLISDNDFFNGQQSAPASKVTEVFDYGLANDEQANLRSPLHSSLEPTLTVMGESRMRGDMPSDFGREVPRFMVTGPTPTSVAWFFWRLGVMLALICLMLQAVYVMRNDLAATAPVLRPWLESACQWVGCEVQYPKHAERISIQASSLQQDTRVQDGSDINTFKLRFALQNRFDKPQAWPHLLVLLTDASGTVVVRKVVPPVDYVPKQLNNTAFMSQQEVNFVVDLQVKGLTISGFEIDKFYP